jgi:di/tricarboxylate transporter
MPYAIALVVAVVVAAATGLVPIVAAAVAGALGMVVVGALRGEEAYEAINWTVLFLLAGVIPLGTALEETGGAQLVADAITDGLAGLGPTAVLAGVFLATQLLTAVISNNAAALLFAPIAISTAQSLGADPRPFLFAVTIAASMSFLTPIGYQTNTMIYGPGQYRFADFAVIGGPLNLVVLVVATIALPILFPF